MKVKKFRKLIWLLAAVVCCELLVGNYSSIRSLSGRRLDLTDRIRTEGDLEQGEDGTLVSGSGSFSLIVSDLAADIGNLYFNWEITPGQVLAYRIFLTDEGDYYPCELPEGHLVGGIPSTLYTNLYTYGKVNSLRIEVEAGGPVSFRMNGLVANAGRPFFPDLWRMGMLTVAGLLLLLLNEKSGLWEKEFRPESRKQNLAAAGMIVLFLLLGVGLSHANSAWVEERLEHHQQYKELAEALAEGHVWVDDQPSEELLKAPNPYDTIRLQAGQIPYRADYAWFQGKYYVYFGIVPELLFYLPCFLLTGKGFPNHLAVLLFYEGFVISVFGLYREAARRWFPGLPSFAWPLAASVTLAFGNYVYLIVRPDLYHVPIMGANMFTAAGLWLWTAGLNREKGREFCFLAGSLCMALVAGCRPQMLLFSALALPLFWNTVFRERRLFSRKTWTKTVAFIAPYLLVAAGIMYYNYLRFGSPFDFGATYSLTSNDMTKRGTNLSRIVCGIFFFFFQPARYEGAFPFLTGGEIQNAYMGRLISEFTFGGILASHMITWVLLLLPGLRGELKERAPAGLIEGSVLISFITGAFDADGAGILQRYMADMVWGIAFATGLMLLLLFSMMKERRITRGSVLLKAALLQHFLYAFLMIFACGDSMNLKNYGQQLFYRAAEMFRW